MEAIIQKYLTESDQDEQKLIIKTLITFLDKHKLEISNLVDRLKNELTSDDADSRIKGTMLLSQVIPSKHLKKSAISSLVDFFCSRIDDRRCLIPVTLGLLNLSLHHPLCKGEPTRIINDIFTKLIFQGLLQQVRFNLWSIILNLLEKYSEEISHSIGTTMHVTLAIEGERDPRNLMKCFSVTSHVIDIFPNVSEETRSELFDVLSSFFPIDFKPPKHDEFHITTDDLRIKLRKCFLFPSLASHVIPFLIDKMSVNDTTESPLSVMCRVECIETLQEYIETLDIKHISPYISALWESFRLLSITIKKESSFIIFIKILSCISAFGRAIFSSKSTTIDTNLIESLYSPIISSFIQYIHLLDKSLVLLSFPLPLPTSVTSLHLPSLYPIQSPKQITIPLQSTQMSHLQAQPLPNLVRIYSMILLSLSHSNELSFNYVFKNVYNILSDNYWKTDQSDYYRIQILYLIYELIKIWHTQPSTYDYHPLESYRESLSKIFLHASNDCNNDNIRVIGLLGLTVLIISASKKNNIDSFTPLLSTQQVSLLLRSFFSPMFSNIPNILTTYSCYCYTFLLLCPYRIKELSYIISPLLQQVLNQIKDKIIHTEYIEYQEYYSKFYSFHTYSTLLSTPSLFSSFLPNLLDILKSCNKRMYKLLDSMNFNCNSEYLELQGLIIHIISQIDFIHNIISTLSSKLTLNDDLNLNPLIYSKSKIPFISNQLLSQIITSSSSSTSILSLSLQSKRTDTIITNSLPIQYCYDQFHVKSPNTFQNHVKTDFLMSLDKNNNMGYFFARLLSLLTHTSVSCSRLISDNNIQKEVIVTIIQDYIKSINDTSKTGNIFNIQDDNMARFFFISMLSTIPSFYSSLHMLGTSQLSPFIQTPYQLSDTFFSGEFLSKLEIKDSIIMRSIGAIINKLSISEEEYSKTIIKSIIIPMISRVSDCSLSIMARAISVQFSVWYIKALLFRGNKMGRDLFRQLFGLLQSSNNSIPSSLCFEIANCFSYLISHLDIVHPKALDQSIYTDNNNITTFTSNLTQSIDLMLSYDIEHFLDSSHCILSTDYINIILMESIPIISSIYDQCKCDFNNILAEMTHIIDYNKVKSIDIEDSVKNSITSIYLILSRILLFTHPRDLIPHIQSIRPLLILSMSHSQTLTCQKRDFLLCNCKRNDNNILEILPIISLYTLHELFIIDIHSILGDIKDITNEKILFSLVIHLLQFTTHFKYSIRKIALECLIMIPDVISQTSHQNQNEQQSKSSLNSYSSKYKLRNIMLNGLINCLDDKKRLIRQLSGKCRSIWFSLPV